MISPSDCKALRDYYDSGATRSLQFRKSQLIKLRQALLAHEQDIYKALYDDLKKGKEESYATELGLIIAEINFTLRHLRRWMLPQQTNTDFVNLPSSSYIQRHPKGVVLIISPWNYPLQLLLIPLVGAIAGGNTAVLKPSEMAPAVSALVEKIISDAFTPEYIKVVTGDGAELIPAMMKSFRFDHVFFTGSTIVGKAIYQLAAESLVPVSLELGGKSPALVESDAHLASTARRILLGKFVNAGQTCVAPDYVLVHESVKEKLTNAMVSILKDFYGTDASASQDYGKIINEKRFDKLTGYLGQGRIVHGGRFDKSKLFIEPTLMEDVPLDAGLMKDEIFGPILPIFTYGSKEEAKKIISLHPNPLAFYLFTSSAEKEKHWMDEVSFGGGCVNNSGWQFTNYNLPFGGVGDSGIGAYHGKYSFDTFTHPKAVLRTPSWFDPSIKYPPFKGRLNIFKFFFK